MTKPTGDTYRQDWGVMYLNDCRDERKTLLARVDDLEGELRVLKGMWAETIVNLSRRIDELTISTG